MDTNNIVALSYHHQTLEAVQMGGQLWLRGGQMCHPLGLSDYRSVQRIFEKNADEFTSDETRVIPLPTDGGIQQTRVFSLRGTRLLALLARTPEAKAFRRWVLDVLDGKVQRRRLAQAELALPGTHNLPTETVRALDEAVALIDDGHPARQILTELRDGVRSMASDPLMERLVAELGAARALHGEANRAYRQVARQAASAGYTLDGVKMAARRALAG